MVRKARPDGAASRSDGARAVEDGELFAPRLDLPPVAIPQPDIVKPPRRSGAPKPHAEGHRERLRQRFERASADALEDYELLETLLTRTIPRRDTKPLAKALLDKFGDIAAVLAAAPARICEVDGAGPKLAQDLKIVHAVAERALKAKLRQRSVISSWATLMDYCRTKLAHQQREQFRVLFLDSKNNLIADELQNQGTIDHAPVFPREVARRALELAAAAVILVHNHPSGDPRPSAADVAVTRDVAAAAAAVGVRVHDHVVIGREGAASLKSLGLM